MSDGQEVLGYLQGQLILAIREFRSGDVVEIEGVIKAFKNIYYKSIGVE